MKIKITYLDNSGFSVETQNHNFIFDYYNGKADLDGNGVVSPEKLARKSTFVFVSHGHYDHYNPAIFNWLKGAGDVTYIFSDDIRTYRDVIRAAPNSSLNVNGIEIDTFKSTDEGVAFLIKADGAVIYHAGDLNWWDWEGEPKEWLRQMERDYKTQISKLKGRRINVAFAPVDPRLERNMGKGARFLIDTANIDLLVPMHYGAAARQARDFIRANFANEKKTVVASPLKRGQSIIYETFDEDGKEKFKVKTDTK